MKQWRCTACNHILEGNNPPEKCPICNKGTENLVEEENREPEPVNNFKKATRSMSYGLYVVCSSMGNSLNGQVSNAAFQVTTNPTTLAISVNKDNLTREYIDESGYFTLNILGIDNFKLVRRFGFRSGREFDKFKNIKYNTTENDTPYLLDAAGWVECRIITEKTIEIGTHIVYIADVLNGDMNNDTIEPMTYTYYRKNK